MKKTILIALAFSLIFINKGFSQDTIKAAALAKTLPKVAGLTDAEITLEIDKCADGNVFAQILCGLLLGKAGKCLQKFGATFDDYKKDGIFNGDSAVPFIESNCSTDFDGDGVDNLTDNCPIVKNEDQADTDNNLIGNVCEDLTKEILTGTVNGKNIEETHLIPVCVADIRDQTEVSVTKADGGGYGLEIKLPLGGAIQKAKIIVSNTNYKNTNLKAPTVTATCPNNMTSEANLLGTTSQTVNCTLSGIFKGSEEIVAILDYKTDDRTCSMSFGYDTSLALSTAKAVTPTGGNDNDRSGGACSLNASGSTSNFGWILDMLILSLPAVSFGLRRRK